MPRSASPVSQATHSTPYSTRLAQRHNGAALALLISTTSQPSRHSLPPAATTTTVRLDYLSCQQSSIHPPTPPLLTIFTILQPSSVNSQFTPTHSHLRPPPPASLSTTLTFPTHLASQSPPPRSAYLDRRTSLPPHPLGPSARRHTHDPIVHRHSTTQRESTPPTYPSVHRSHSDPHPFLHPELTTPPPTKELPASTAQGVPDFAFPHLTITNIQATGLSANMASPPSFDTFYGQQQPQQSSGSFDYPSTNPTYTQQQGDQQYGTMYVSEEPQGMAGDDGWQGGGGDYQHQQHRQLHPNTGGSIDRKESVPFDPTSSSTIIASASQPNGGFQGQQFQPHLHQQQMIDPNLGSGEHNNMLDPMNNSRPGSWHGSQQQLDELHQIISNPNSRPSTPGNVSRVASPFMEPNQQQLNTASNNITRSPSPYGGPSPYNAPSPYQAPSPYNAASPYGGNSSVGTPGAVAPSPGTQRSSVISPDQNSPSFSKPQSPPALVIPNSSSSPSMNSLVGTSMDQHQLQQQQQQGAGNFGNSLLPPANPALEHLTGMAGISPIAPNADGPMITIQPSTPISGLRDQKGIFDDALRRANAANAQWKQEQQNNLQQDQRSQTSNQDPATFIANAQAWSQSVDLNGMSLETGHPQMRPRARSESYASGGDAFERQAIAQVQASGIAGPDGFVIDQSGGSAVADDQWRDINAWRTQTAGGEDQYSTMDPRQLPGNGYGQPMQQFQQDHDIRRQQLGQINTNIQQQQPQQPGQISPDSMRFYSELGLNPQAMGQQQMYQQPQRGFLEAGQSAPRRRSFNDGVHPAAGAGTPGYGVEFSVPGGVVPQGRLRGGSFGSAMGHRRAVRSEDFSAMGTGWGVGAGGSTADFLQSITNPDDGTLLPPSMRGRSMSHSRHSSASSVRSASPALSISSQGSSFSHHSHMEMPEGAYFPGDMYGQPKVAKMRVTSQATEVASQSRRTNSGVFKCPIPGCGSTFTRHFNLKGHLRSHNDERPYKCIYEGCPKSIVGFARQHDCKRHMLLHDGVRPFECEGCGKKFARLDALTRHHKSEQGQECAISHPLPTNPDGSPMSESQYKAYQTQKGKEQKPLAV